jgi:TPP-dependent pyruvate/acetoin dehydrogenase alpha subunit
MADIIEAEVEELIADAVEFARASAVPADETASHYMYAGQEN